MDDKNQKLSVGLDQIYFWEDERIKIDEGHSFWSNDVNLLSLDGDFVKDCLWMPNLQVKHLHSLSVIKPTPTSMNGSPFKVLLAKNGVVQVEYRNVQMTVSCSMEFDKYPFDQQV